jgi:serine/threonine-protein kinase RsbW
MCEVDMAQMTSIALRPETARCEAFVEFKYSLYSDVAMVSPFVDQVMRLIQSLRVTDGSELDIEIALREALLNAVIHGNREDPCKHVHLTVRCSADGEVWLAIQDEGAGFDSRCIPDPTAPELRMSSHGRGIYLMRALMDEVSFEEDGAVVHMRKDPTSPPR